MVTVYLGPCAVSIMGNADGAQVPFTKLYFSTFAREQHTREWTGRDYLANSQMEQDRKYRDSTIRTNGSSPSLQTGTFLYSTSMVTPTTGCAKHLLQYRRFNRQAVYLDNEQWYN